MIKTIVFLTLFAFFLTPVGIVTVLILDIGCLFDFFMMTPVLMFGNFVSLIGTVAYMSEL